MQYPEHYHPEYGIPSRPGGWIPSFNSLRINNEKLPVNLRDEYNELMVELDRSYSIHHTGSARDRYFTAAEKIKEFINRNEITVDDNTFYKAFNYWVLGIPFDREAEMRRAQERLAEMRRLMGQASAREGSLGGKHTRNMKYKRHRYKFKKTRQYSKRR
jgi:hypothetical protein